MGFVVNKTNNVMPVYDLTSGDVIGRINIGETAYLTENIKVRFLNSSGEFSVGSVDNPHLLTSWLDAPYYDLEGKKWFRARYDMAVYDANGTPWGEVKAGEFVWTDNAACKSDHADWMMIKGVRNYYTKEWETMNDGFGFVDTGFYNIGSGRNYIGIYGNW